MSFRDIEKQLRSIKQEIQEINQSIKGLVTCTQLIISTFEGTLKPRQRKEYIPLEIKLPTRAILGIDDENYLKRFHDKLLKKMNQL